jgi:hypothetical protein
MIIAMWNRNNISVKSIDGMSYEDFCKSHLDNEMIKLNPFFATKHYLNSAMAHFNNAHNDSDGALLI